MFLWTFTHIKLASHKSKLHLPGVTSLVTKCTFLSVASTLASTSLHFSSRVFAAEKYDLTHHKMFLHLEAGPRMCEAIIKHCKNCECCPVSLLIVKSQRLSEFRFSIVRIVISVSNVAIPAKDSLWMNGVSASDKVVTAWLTTSMIYKEFLVCENPGHVCKEYEIWRSGKFYQYITQGDVWDHISYSEKILPKCLRRNDMHEIRTFCPTQIWK